MGSAGDEHDDGSPDDFDESQRPDEDADDEDDEDEEEAQPGGGPPHPLDRLWFHPSELASFAPTRPGSSRRTRRAAPVWVVPVASGAIGALVAIAILAAFGTLDRSSTDRNTGLPASRSDVRAEAVSARVQGIGQSVVAVAARDANGARRGSGVCLQNKHEVLTSIQVVGDAKKVELTTLDGRQHTARVVGRDAVTGLALLAVSGTLSVAPVASRAPAVGDAVWILGAPAAGEAPWYSDGVVASIDAMVALEAGPTTSGLLETNAMGNAWAAGGALVDAEAVVAIVLAPVDGSRTSFAMPVETALSVADSLRAHGEVAHGSLGLEGVDDPETGPTVIGFPDGGSASKAGVKVGDVVLSVAGRQVDSMVQVMAIVRSVSPGATVPVVVRRGQRQVKLSVPVGSTVPKTTTTSAAPVPTSAAPTPSTPAPEG